MNQQQQTKRAAETEISELDKKQVKIVKRSNIYKFNTTEICLTHCKVNGLFLGVCEIKCEEVVMAAVNQNGMAL